MKWTPNLSIGVEPIDVQHREIFARAERLGEAARAGRGGEEIGQLLSFLGDYVVAHFGMEEDLMSLHGYPAHRLHQAEHQAFARDLAGLRRQYETRGADLLLVFEVRDRVSSWLASHIERVDWALGQFLRPKLGREGN